MLLDFYAPLLNKKAIIEESIGKKPARTEATRIVYKDTFHLQSFLRQNPNGQLRLTLPQESNMIVVDFDLVKEGFDEKTLEKVKQSIIEYSKDNDCTIVESPSGGLHLYTFGASLLEHKNYQSIIPLCGLRKVDYLVKGVCSPSLQERKILYISSS
jgi:hypothetical protein